MQLLTSSLLSSIPNEKECSQAKQQKTKTGCLAARIAPFPVRRVHQDHTTHFLGHKASLVATLSRATRAWQKAFQQREMAQLVRRVKCEGVAEMLQGPLAKEIVVVDVRDAVSSVSC